MGESKLISQLSQTDFSIGNFPFQLSPTYSFAKASKKVQSCFHLPEVGLGQSKFVLLENAPKRSQMRFDKYSSRREMMDMTNVPGPNFYNPQQPKLGGAITMRRKSHRNILRTQQLNLDSISPGPGAYNVEAKKTQVGGLQLTFHEFMHKSKPNFSNNHKSPGVGEYELGVNKKNLTGCIFPKSNIKMRTFIMPSPGPSTYNQVMNKTQGILISKSERKWEYLQQKHDSLHSPGPGTYNYDTQSKFRQSKFSFSNKTKKLKVVDQFDDNLLSQCPQGFSSFLQDKNRSSLINFAVSKRNFEFLDVMGLNSKSQRSPGPAQYSSPGLEVTRNKGMSFSNSKRSDIARKDFGPGVGSYTTIGTMGKIYDKPIKKAPEKIYNLKDISGYVVSE